MALTRLRTNQYSDALAPTTAASLDAGGNVVAGSANIGSGITGQKIEYYTITGDKWAPNITAYSNLTIAGTLTVLGDVSSIEAQQTRVTDSIIGLAYGANTAANTVTNTLYTYTSSGDDTVPDGEIIGTTLNTDQSVSGQFNGVNVSVTTSNVTTSYQNDVDVGFIGIKDPLNFAAVYSSSSDAFVLGWTPDNELVSTVSFSSYANIRANVGIFDGMSLGNIIIANNTISTDGASSIIIRPNASDADANIYLYAGNIIGNSLISTTGNIEGANLVTSGTVEATGNVSGGNLTTTGAVEATGDISGDNLIATNDVSGATVTASGNISGDNIVASTDVVATGDVSGTNITASANVTATGDVSATNVVASGNVDADSMFISTFAGIYELEVDTTITAQGNITGDNLIAVNDLSAATLTIAGNITGGNLVTSGVVDATGNIIGGNITTTGAVEATGNVSGGNLTTTGAVEATGDISGDNLIAANDVSTDTVTATGNISGANIVTTGAVEATGNVSGGNLTTTGEVSATGNVSGDNLISSADIIAGANISGVNVTATGDVDVTGNVDAGNVNVTGTVDAQTGIFQDLSINNDLTVSGNLQVQGNLTYLDVETLRTEDTIIDLNTASNGEVSGNIITGVDSGIRSYYDDDTSSFFGRIDASGEFVYYSDVSAAANATSITGTIGNIRGGNLISNGDVTTSTVTASGNISGDNLIATNDVSGATVTASGNISGDNLISTNDVTTVTVTASGDVTGANLVTSGNVDGVGAVFSGNVTADTFIGNIDAAGNDTEIQFNSGDRLSASANLTFDNSGSGVLSVGYTSGGAIETDDITSATVSATGNVSGDNIIASTDVIATGDISGANINASADVTATGNVSGDNIIATNDVSTDTLTATGNISGANITTSGDVEATGNITGDNVIAVNDLSASTLTISGNVTGGNLVTSGVVEATGNISGGNLTTAGTVEATGNVSGANIVTTGDVEATGNLIADNLVISTNSSTLNLEVSGSSNLGNITISGDTITNKESGNDVIISPSANGDVIINSAFDPDYQFNVYGSNANLLVVSGDQVAIWSNTYVDGDGTTIDFAFTPNIALDIQSNLSMRIPTGNTSQRPGNPTQGMLRFNTADAVIEWYDGSNWEQARTGGQAIEIYSFTGNGAVDFDIPNGEADSNLVFVAINGVIQQPGAGNSYTITSDPGAGTSTITFTEAPESLDTIDIRVMGVVDTLTGFSYGSASFVVTGGDTWSVTGDLIPSANVTYDLGSDAKRWANLHLAGNTIHLGGAQIKYDGSQFSFTTDGTTAAPLTGTATFSEIIKSGTDGTGNIGQTNNRFNTVFAQATSALYADLAENYKGDQSYAPGTVVMFGGDEEVTQCNEEGCQRVAGVVSTAPAYLMNDNGQENMVSVALQGRVPTQVRGPVRKGDMMVSAGDGRAMASSNPKIGSVIGKAIENFDGDVGIIEVVVGRL